MNLWLPNQEEAYIPELKITGYLLSNTHPVGRFKARILRELGYDENNVGALVQDFLDIAHNRHVTESVETRYGTKYVIDGVLMSPDGRSLQVRTVWIIDADDLSPRFVTAYPI